jgi:hypothetical protein
MLPRHVTKLTYSQCDPPQFNISLYTGSPPRSPYNLCRSNTAVRKREIITREKKTKRGTRTAKKKKMEVGWFVGW